MPRKVMAAFIAACVACLLVFATSCRDSDALTEVIYDQTSDIIDYDNPAKIYVNDFMSDVESEEVAAMEVGDDASRVSDTVQNLVVYGSDPNTEGFTAKKSAFSPTPDFEGIEASETVSFYYSDDPGALDHPVTTQETEEEGEEDDQQPQSEVTTVITAAQDSTGASGGTVGESGSGDSDGQDTDEPQPGTDEPTDVPDPDPDPQPVEDDDGAGNSGAVDVGYDSSDPTQEPPKVESVAAYGPMATLVQMLGGTGALAATDAQTLSGKFSSVFDASAIATGWAQDGSDVAFMDIDAVIASGAGTILVYSGDYLSGLSPDDVKKLNDAGITQTVVYPMVNSGNIKHDATVVAEMLSESSKAQYASTAMARASSYVAFHDEVVGASAAANGGLAGTLTYESGNDAAAPAHATSVPTYTLLIDEYDASATYTGGAVSGWLPSNGLALASAGYGSTPVSYYMQAGGLVNNAADKTIMAATGKVVAWQFMANSFPFNANQWSGTASVKNATSPTEYSLLTTTVNLHGIFPFGSSFGSDVFPRVIVTSRDIESELISNSERANGTYHPYANVPYGSDSAYTMFGPVSLVPSCIGFDGTLATDKNLFVNAALSDESIVVNPTGLFSDWTQGSVESFLESAWVNDVAKGSDTKVGWKSYVERFYSEFYGYALTASDWSAMNPEGA